MQRGADRWSASCPSHQGKNPSLSIRELPDGRVLVRCWAGCDVAEVVAAAGATLGPIELSVKRRRAPDVHRKTASVPSAEKSCDRSREYALTA
jgi:hypothetical protein